jgi:3D (Asp-Asp-Asp) domain-containing protein
LIDRDHRPATLVATSALIASLLLAGATAASASPHRGLFSAHAATATIPAQGVTVTIVQDGIGTSYVTRAKTVADFLSERDIVPGPADEISPSPQTDLSEGMRVDYRSAVPVSLIIGREHREVMTTAQNVAALLAAQGISLGTNDRVQPAPDESLRPGTVVHVSRQASWTVRSNQHIAPSVVQRYDPMLAPGTVKTIAGTPGLIELTTRFVQRDGESLQEQVVATRIVRQPRAKLVLHGIGEYASFAAIARRGFDETIRLAGNAMHMVATAYTASCGGCSGITASGRPAGHGIVAVDPRFIPLGSRLYIPGYGHAIAGDTGGAIKGNRIDLGFNSLRDALLFGRRAITVYVLR